MSRLQKEVGAALVVICDGCGWDDDNLSYFNSVGYQMRYCAKCADHWRELCKADEALHAKYQRMLEAEYQEVRKRSPLKLVPTDLPKELVTLG